MNRLSIHSYKNADWLGGIPSHWEISKLKYIFTEKKSTKNPSLNSGSISFGEVIYKNDEKISESTKNSYQEVLNGEFLINPLNLNFDLKSLRIALSKIDVVVSQGYIVLKINEGFLPDYFKFLLRKFDVEHMKSLGQGVRQTISYNDIKDEYLLIPPLSDQKIIARFLNNKTQKIDALIKKIENKIKLLKEEKNALSNQYVSRGINLNIEVKKSGVDWIGDIPINWEVKKLKYLAEEILEKRKPTLGEIKISPENVESNSGKINDFYSNYDGDGKVFLEGDILFNKLRVYLNKVIFCQFNGLSMGEMIVIRPKSIYGEFLHKVLSSSKFIDYINSFSQGVKVPRPPIHRIFDSYIPIPPLDKQQEISAVLKNKLKNYDTLVEKYNLKIRLIKENSQALISSIVTGKIRITEDMI